MESKLEEVRLSNMTKMAVMEHLVAKGSWHPVHEPSTERDDAWKELIEACPDLNDAAYLANGQSYAASVSVKKKISFPSSWLDHGLRLFQMFTRREEMTVRSYVLVSTLLCRAHIFCFSSLSRFYIIHICLYFSGTRLSEKQAGGTSRLAACR